MTCSRCPGGARDSSRQLQRRETELIGLLEDLVESQRLQWQARQLRVEVSGETVFFYTAQARPLLAALEAHPALRTLHRPANLEDLFLKLTGRQIREEG